MKRHLRRPNWSGGVFNPLRCSAEERRFEVLKGSGSSIGIIEFSSYKLASASASSPWGQLEVRRTSRIGPKCEILRNGTRISFARFNALRSKLVFEFTSGQWIRFRRTKVFWTMQADTDLGSAVINLDGMCAPTGEKMWEMEKGEANRLGKSVETLRPPQVKGVKRPKDIVVRYGTSEEPFYMQWSMVLPGALQDSEDIIASVAVLVAFRWLIAEIPSG